MNVVHVGDAALQQVADPLAAGEELHRMLDLDVRGENEDRRSPASSSRITRAASRPSVA